MDYERRVRQLEMQLGRISSMMGQGDQPVISVLNSTDVALSGGATYTGTWERAPRSMVMVQSYSDVSGTLYFDFSTDGVNADSTFPVLGVVTSANVPTVQPAAVGGRYFRARYVNGSGAQSTFRLESSYSDFTNFYSPLNQSYNLTSPATLTRSTWTWLDVAQGLAGGIDSVKKFGRNDSVGTTFEPVCMGGVYRTPQISGAVALRIKAGGNANDDTAGTGARKIILIGTDENFEEATEELTTAGTSASSYSTTTFTRLYRVYVSESGTYATATASSHAGDIVIEDGTNDWATLDSTDISKSQSEIGAYTIPAGKTGFVWLRNVSIDSGKTIDLDFFFRGGCDDTAAPYQAMRSQSVITGVAGGSIESFGEKVVPYGPFVGPEDVGFLAKVSSGSASVSVEFEIILIDT